ncbi:uncharacterized protein LOC124277024 [Haliotis rubra]|uniref:uncharacterized protein LOC124277024 n=1 Tax=Haliotis rubra TaxID=36100 RepID=UPI001EE5B248|nr:uncharacterized protein LOC124277024 [Haliotis rubra]
MSAKDLESLVKMGEKMGFTGADLSSFVERERQAITAEKERVRYEHERELAMALEKEKLLLERENLEREEKAVCRAHEKEMKALDVSQGRHSHIPLPVGNRSKPKLTPFDERRDNIDSYLNRFERYATCNQWLEEEWANILSALLTGKALEVYSRSEFEAANDYQALKQALLRRFRLNDEGFRMKFRNSKIEADESCVQFIARLRNYLSRWVELSDTVKTYDGICDLLLREQFLMTCSRPLSVFLKERKLKNAGEMANVADQYAEAHRGMGSSESRDKAYNGKGLQKDSSSSVNSGASIRRSCYICNRADHLFRDCPVRKQYKKETFVGKQKLGAIKVTESSSVGACMDMQTKRSSGQVAASEVELIQGKDRSPAEKVNVVMEEEAKKDSLPVVSSVCIAGNMPVKTGLVGDCIVLVLRDTGCSTVVVRKSVVNPSSFMKVSKKCIMLDGTVREVPTARIEVDTPYYEGSVEALVMDNPLYDLVLGNIPGV